MVFSVQSVEDLQLQRTPSLSCRHAHPTGRGVEGRVEAGWREGWRGGEGGGGGGGGKGGGGGVGRGGRASVRPWGLFREAG